MNEICRINRPGRPAYALYNTKTWEQISPVEWDDGGEFKGGLCPVRRGNLWGLINTRGEIVLEPCYVITDILQVIAL